MTCCFAQKSATAAARNLTAICNANICTFYFSLQKYCFFSTCANLFAKKMFRSYKKSADFSFFCTFYYYFTFLLLYISPPLAHQIPIYAQCMLNVCSMYAQRDHTVTKSLFLIVFKDLIKADKNEILLQLERSIAAVIGNKRCISAGKHNR